MKTEDIKTEDWDPAFAELDQWDTARALDKLHQSQVAAVTAVGPALPHLARAV